MLAGTISSGLLKPVASRLFLKRLLNFSILNAAGVRKPDSEFAEYIEDDGLPKDYKIKRITLDYRHMNIFLKQCIPNMTQKDILTMFSRGNVRKNENVVTKKTALVDNGDEIDVWESEYEENSQLANIQRLEVLDMKNEEQGYVFTVKCYKNMIVDNWK